MSSENETMDLTYRQLFDEACWPIMMIWERINHAYTSDSPPKDDWGSQQGDYGFQGWSFSSHNESYTVVWDTDRSYWKVNSPFGESLYLIGPLFIDKSEEGLFVPPAFTVKSDIDILKPAQELKVSKQMRKIISFVNKKGNTSR